MQPVMESDNLWTIRKGHEVYLIIKLPVGYEIHRVYHGEVHYLDSTSTFQEAQKLIEEDAKD